jgi:hypothetical protein
MPRAPVPTIGPKGDVDDHRPVGAPSAFAAKTPLEARDLGIRWLIQRQGADGGWGSGGHGVANAAVPSDVATTSLVVLSMLRDGGVNKHRAPIEKAVDYVAGVVEKSDGKQARLAVVQGTQPQYKLGQLVDTHLAALMLGEIDGRLGGARDLRVRNALSKVIDMVQHAQRADGSFDGEGWAPVISTSIAAQSLYTAKEKNIAVREDVLDKADAYQRNNVDEKSGAVSTSAGAGVDLYAVAGALRGNQQAKARGEAAAAPAMEAVARRVAADDGRLVSGFGSMGGEEMLSYMMISDALAEEDPKKFADWQARIGEHLRTIQNADGGWVGHHCITSPVFVTAGAVMTLGAGPKVKAVDQRQGALETPAPAVQPAAKAPAETAATSGWGAWFWGN